MASVPPESHGKTDNGFRQLLICAPKGGEEKIGQEAGNFQCVPLGEFPYFASSNFYYFGGERPVFPFGGASGASWKGATARPNPNALGPTLCPCNVPAGPATASCWCGSLACSAFFGLPSEVRSHFAVLAGSDRRRQSMTYALSVSDFHCFNQLRANVSE